MEITELTHSVTMSGQIEEVNEKRGGDMVTADEGIALGDT